MELLPVFAELNSRHFDGFLDPPVLRWNGRLRTSAGRFFPGTRRRAIFARQPVIEVASYLRDLEDGATHIRETLAHEMIHYWLWVRSRPHGHTEEFYSKMKEMGARRYNPVPKLRPHKYLYGCPHCSSEFKSRKKLGRLACAQCCKSLSDGKYNERFRLVLLKNLSTLGVMAIAAIWMVRDTGARQCEPFDLNAVEKSVKAELASRKVKWLKWEHQPQGAKGSMRIQLCGSPTGGRFRIQIRTSQKAAAEAAGFKAE